MSWNWEHKVPAHIIKFLSKPRHAANSISHFERLVFEAIDIAINRLGGETQLIKLEFINFSPNEYVSNSHSCPVGGVTNWCRMHNDKGYPNGYPGWEGEIVIVISNNKYSNVTEILRKVEGINTGTGGFASIQDKIEGRTTMKYDLKLFESDFPKLRGELIAKRIGVL